MIVCQDMKNPASVGRGIDVCENIMCLFENVAKL